MCVCDRQGLNALARYLSLLVFDFSNVLLRDSERRVTPCIEQPMTGRGESYHHMDLVSMDGLTKPFS